jgi:hypothetical protein
MRAFKFSIVFVFFISLSALSYAQEETDPRLHAVGRQWGLYQPPDTAKSKRVLLIGDSILGGYWSIVSGELTDSVAVDCWITGINEGSPSLFSQLEQVMSHGPYDVVHFNIGLHGWQKGRVDDSKYEAIMQHYIDVLKKGSPHAHLIWATTTPVTVKDHPSRLNKEINPIIVRRNRMALTVMKKNYVDIDDLYGLMVKHLPMAKGDMFHWKPEGVQLESKSVMSSIKKAFGEGIKAL